MSEAQVNEEFINELIRETGEVRFRVLKNISVKKLGRELRRSENQTLNKVLHQRKSQNSEEIQTTATSNPRIIIVTAYTDNYCLGKICEFINRQYAALHEYEFVSHISSFEQMIQDIKPKNHPTWYKIMYLRSLFNDFKAKEGEQMRETFFVWIDADAIVINSAIRIEDIILRAKGRDFIVGEDINVGCLINAGVFLLRFCDWSKTFLEEIWNCHKYDDTTFYEQSAMIRYFRMHGEGMDVVYKPFHTHVSGAFQGDKLFNHLAVLPHWDINSNRGVSAQDIQEYNKEIQILTDCENDAVYHGSDNEERIFIFHPAGAKNKMLYIKAAIKKFNVQQGTDLLALFAQLEQRPIGAGAAYNYANPTLVS